MKFLNDLSFWTKLWTIWFGLLLTFIPFDILAVIRGKADKVGDSFTLTHWLATRLGVSVIGAIIGYLIAHFLIVHVKG